MQLNPQEIRINFLNAIMEEHHVSKKSINECKQEREDDIYSMDQIFNSDDEMSVRIRMVLLSLISRNHRNENMDYYQKVKNINIKNEDFEADIAKYTILIITALMFNETFYVRACNWCGLIRREVGKMGKGLERGKTDTRIHPPKQKYGVGRMVTRLKSGKTYPPIHLPEPKNDALAAATAGFKIFHQEYITQNDIRGTLYFMGNDQDEIFLEFKFEKYQEPFPFELKVHFRTKGDPEEHIIPIPANNAMEGNNTIKSEIKDAYYKDGIVGEYTVILKPLGNQKIKAT